MIVLCFIISISTMAQNSRKKSEASMSDGNNHEYVDLGLHSGTLWATCNIGAETEADFGDFFAWGETKPKEDFTQKNYSCKNKAGGLEASNDAARANWGDEWTMPTQRQWVELVMSCKMKWTAMKTKSGEKVYGYKIIGSNKNYIFLPAAGFKNEEQTVGVAQIGSYWSSSADRKYPNIKSNILKFNKKECNLEASGCPRIYGMSVRPVRKNPNARISENEMNLAYVDLGLPSGTLWATTNIGADNDRSEGDEFSMTQIGNEKNYNDPAAYNWGSDWKIPTLSQWKELESYCSWEENSNGYKITSRKTGKSIFLITGRRSYGTTVPYLCSSFQEGKTVGVEYRDGNYKSKVNADATGFLARPVRAETKEVTHDFVDLGLPSGTLWAAENLDAYMPSDPGEYYAWGEISSKNTYTIENYKWAEREYPGQYLKPAHDVATQSWGKNWEIPTKEQWAELNQYCEWHAEKEGYTVRSKKNGNSIYLPAAGLKIKPDPYAYEKKILYDYGDEGHYMTASSVSVSSKHAYTFMFDGSKHKVQYEYSAHAGYSVRPVRTSGKLHDQRVAALNPQKTRLTPSGSITSSNGQRHDYVDMGLPSGTLWATCNVGASNPWNYGDYVSWGETSPKSNYYTNYKYEDTKYLYHLDGFDLAGLPKGYHDLLRELEPSDDAAYVKWGNRWRTPSVEQFIELKKYCKTVWVVVNGVKGRAFTGPNGNTIFLPATGLYYGTQLGYEGEEGFYWSRRMDSRDEYTAFCLHFDETGAICDTNYRVRGQCVRPVVNK